MWVSGDTSVSRAPSGVLNSVKLPWSIRAYIFILERNFLRVRFISYFVDDTSSCTPNDDLCEMQLRNISLCLYYKWKLFHARWPVSCRFCHYIDTNPRGSPFSVIIKVSHQMRRGRSSLKRAVNEKHGQTSQLPANTTSGFQLYTYSNRFASPGATLNRNFCWIM